MKNIYLFILCCLFQISAFAQMQQINGNVFSAPDRKPLSGVKIKVQGKNTESVTNESGRYKIDASCGDTLVFSYPEYISKKISVPQKKRINVSLSVVESSRLANNLLLTSMGDNKGEVTGRVYNWINQSVSGAKVKLTFRKQKITTVSNANGAYSIKIPQFWSALEPGFVKVEATYNGNSTVIDLPSCEIYPPVVILTPRPVKVGSVGDNLRVDLNGTWNFTVQPPVNFWKSGAVSENEIHSIAVPGEWSMQGFTVPSKGAAGYWRTVKIPLNWNGKRIKLKCDAAFSLAEVWVNDKYAGQYEGGFTPFEFDVTKYLIPGKEAVIALKVTEDTQAAALSSMQKYSQHDLGGITRKIYLFTVPEVNISKLYTETFFDAQYQDANLRLTIGIDNQSRKNVENGRLNFRLVDPLGKEVPLKESSLEIGKLSSQSNKILTLNIPVSKPLHWEDEHPYLYTLYTDLIMNGQASETLKNRIGFRQIEINGNKFLLNGQSMKLRGTERHETNPIFGRSLTPEIWNKEIELLKEANINWLFTSHYPVPEELLDLCDEKGMLVTSEMPMIWKSNTEVEYYNTEALIATSMIEDTRNHPSVIFYQTCDECSWGRNSESLLNLFHLRDETRPVNFSYQAGGLQDFATQHYPSPAAIRALSATGGKPMIYDQYAHINNYNRREHLTDPGLRAYYASEISTLFDEIYANPAVLGGAIWEWSDDVFCVPSSGYNEREIFEGYLDTETGRYRAGYGPWGIVDSWLRKKPEFWSVKKAYSPVHIQRNIVLPKPMNGYLEIPVQNRYNFTNFKELSIKCKVDNQSVSVTADVRPRSEGKISIKLPGEISVPKTVLLKFYDRGRLVDIYHLTAGDYLKESSVCKQLKESKFAPVVKQSDKTIQISGKNYFWKIDKNTGMIISGQSNRSDASLIVGGPFLAVTPAEMAKFGRINKKYMPLQPEKMAWKTKEVKVTQENKEVVIDINGSYPEYSGNYQLRFNSLGNLSIRYDFVYEGPHLQVREIGLMFDLPIVMNTIEWKRKGFWSWYPPEHIGRVEGSACAYRPASYGPRYVSFAKPVWPWELDATSEGTNDFRSTKYNIYHASLLSPEGYGMQVYNSNACQNVRAWLNHDQVEFLITDFSDGGSDPYLLQGSYGEKVKILQKGDKLAGTVHLRFIETVKNK